MILKFLTHKVAPYVIGGVLGALLLLITVQTVRLNRAEVRADNAEAANKKARQDLTRCRDNRQSLEGAVAAQNAAADALADQGRQRIAAAEKATLDAAKGRASAEARANKLLTTPSAGIDTCARTEAARRAVLEGL